MCGGGRGGGGRVNEDRILTNHTSEYEVQSTFDISNINVSKYHIIVWRHLVSFLTRFI